MAAIEARDGWLEGAADPRTEGTAKGYLSMQHVLSTHLFINHRLTVAQLDKIQHAGIPAVEIFCARQHLDYRDQAPRSPNWATGFATRICSCIRIHAPMYNDDFWGRSGPHSVITITEPVKGKRLEMVDEIKRALEIAETIPFKYLVQHLGVSGEEFSERAVDAAFSALEQISLFARQRGVEVLLENIPNALSTRRAPDAFSGTDAPGFELRLRRGPRHIGRGRGGGVRHHEGAHPLHARPRQRRQDDKHLFPLTGEGGTIDWKKTMDLLRTRADQYPLLLELKEAPECRSHRGGLSIAGEFSSGWRRCG